MTMKKVLTIAGSDSSGGAGNRRSVRGTHPSAHAGCMGDSRSGKSNHTGFVWSEISRSALLVRLSGLPEFGRSASLVRSNAAGGYRRELDRQLYDGTRGFRFGHRIFPPAGPIFQCREGGITWNCIFLERERACRPASAT